MRDFLIVLFDLCVTPFVIGAKFMVFKTLKSILKV